MPGRKVCGGLLLLRKVFQQVGIRMGIQGVVFVLQRHRWSRLRGRKQWGACVVWAGWGVRHRGSFPKGGLISCTCVRNQSPEMPGARPLFRSFFSDLGQCHFASCLRAPGRARCGRTQLIFLGKQRIALILPRLFDMRNFAHVEHMGKH